MYRLNDTYVQRSLTVKQNNSSEQLEVQQFQILAWPEEDNPPSLPGLLEVLEDPEVQQPLLVHSRTGIGRTGVIICIHHALKCINAGGKLDLPGLVRHMRSQRGGMVENFEQYKTCILAVLRYLQHVTGFTSMSIKDGAAASSSLPQLEIIHPRTHTVAAHPLVTNVAKQVTRTYSDPTLNGSPQMKRRVFLQDMIPPPPTQPPPTQPPPTQPPPYTDDDAARAPTTPKIPVSPPPPLTPPDNDDFRTATSTAQTSSASPMQFKDDSSTITTSTTTTTTTTAATNNSSSRRRPSIVLDDGENVKVLFESDSALLQRKTVRASQHDETVVTQPHDQLQQETTTEPEIPPQETEENDLFTKTFGSTTSLTGTTTAATTTTTTTSTTTSTTSTTKVVNSTVDKTEPTEVVKSTTKAATDSQQQQRTQETTLQSSTTPDPTVDTRDETQDEDTVKQQVVTDLPPVTQMTTKLFNWQPTMKKSMSVRETAKTFGGTKPQTKSFSHIPKVGSLISERAKLFGGTATPTNSQSKLFGQTQREQKSSVSEITKRFGNVKPPIPPKSPKSTMEDQTLTFTFDNVDGEFTEMKLSRSVEKLDQSEDNDKSTQAQTSTVKTDSPPSDVPVSGVSSTPKFHPINKPPPKQPVTQQPAQRGIKKLDMSKFAMFGKSIND